MRKPLYPRGGVSLLRRLNREPDLVDKVSPGILLKLYAKILQLSSRGLQFCLSFKTNTEIILTTPTTLL